MKISIITFADLGKKNNLKTIDIEPVIKKINQEKKLGQIICRMEKSYEVPNTFSAVSQIVHYSLKILEKLIPIIPVRSIEEEIFDINASRLIQPYDIAIFHPAFFPRTIKIAKEKGIVTVGMAALAHPSNTTLLLEEEYKILKIKNINGKKESKYSHNNKEVANSFDYIIAFSDFIKKSFIENGFPESKIFVAENDIDINIPKLSAAKDSTFRVLYVAHTNTLKGLHYLLEAWTSLKLKNAELVIVGGYSYPIPNELKSKYKEIIRSDQSIKFVGFKKNPQIYYEQASVFVLPSITEGNPRVIMEAMANNLPIITTENAKSIVKDGENGFIVPIRDSSIIADKIKFFYENREICKEMGQSSRVTLENKEKFANEVIKICDKIIEIESDK